MTLSSAVSISTVVHACICRFFFPPSYLWTQPRSESDCMRLADPICVVHTGDGCSRAVGKFCAPANENPRVQPNVFRFQAFGIPGAAFFALQHGPKRIRDLWTAAHLPQTAMDSSQASPLLVTMSYILPESQYYRHATECHGPGRISCSTSSHLFCAFFTQSQMIIIECFLIIDTKRCPAL